MLVTEQAIFYTIYRKSALPFSPKRPRENGWQQCVKLEFCDVLEFLKIRYLHLQTVKLFHDLKLFCNARNGQNDLFDSPNTPCKKTA
jgi:hypothetical protein